MENRLSIEEIISSLNHDLNLIESQVQNSEEALKVDTCSLKDLATVLTQQSA